MRFSPSRRICVVLSAMLFLISSVDAQRRTSRQKSPVKKPVAAKDSPFSENEWNAILTAVEKENWKDVTTLSSAAFLKLKEDNSRRQLARLRYIFLYAFAGRFAEGSATMAELQLAADSLAGKILIGPRRTIREDCGVRLNFICSVDEDREMLRVTATNKNATTIHFFEYFKLPSEFDVKGNDKKEAMLGGILTTFEINKSPMKIWILRLNFSDGFVLSAVED